MATICGECGLPVRVCNRITLLELQVKQLAGVVRDILPADAWYDDNKRRTTEIITGKVE